MGHRDTETQRKQNTKPQMTQIALMKKYKYVICVICEICG